MQIYTASSIPAPYFWFDAQTIVHKNYSTMALLIALLIQLGIIASAAEATPEMLQQYQQQEIIIVDLQIV